MPEEPLTPKLMTQEVKHIKAEVIFLAVETIQKMGETAKAEFLAQCAAENRGMIISKADLNFLKTFIANAVNEPAGEPPFARIVNESEFSAIMGHARRIVGSAPPCE